jgi:D-sedoheptulose 7-phosphate isomerase
MNESSMLDKKIVDIQRAHQHMMDYLVGNDQMLSIINAVHQCFAKYNGKLIIAGNGGSAADAQHMSCEYISRFMFERAALPAIALTTDSSVITAIGNDNGYEQVFSRQIAALGRSSDVALLYSTSGNSPNIIRAAKTAKELDLTVIGFTGESGGKLFPLCDYCLRIPSDSTPRIQEMHGIIGHLICEEVESRMFSKNKGYVN